MNEKTATAVEAKIREMYTVTGRVPGDAEKVLARADKLARDLIKIIDAGTKDGADAATQKPTRSPKEPILQGADSPLQPNWSEATR